MGPGDAALTLVREEVVAICVGTAFVVTGLGACGVAAVRRRGGVRVFAWLGAWSVLYGLQELAGSRAATAALPIAVQPAVPLVKVTAGYLLIVTATLAWRELTLGWVRTLLTANVVAGIVIAAAGIGVFAVGADTRAATSLNTLVAVWGLLILLTAVALPARVARRYLVLEHRGVLAAGTLVFALEALYVNVARPFGHVPPRILNSLGFAALLLSFGYVALRTVGDRERRLQSVENELALARRLQLSLLPPAVPRLDLLRVAAAYEPMTAVAGDFYEFLPVDAHRAGFLVADVSGHGVPAALIASMVKVATQSVAAWAHDPGQLLRRLGNALHGHLRGQYVTAAYLWLDTEARTARYSAAGHPPLVRWRGEGTEADRIESNGLLFGVVPDSDYPVCEIAFAPGDRFLVYTDGLIEAENAAGEAFGDSKLQEVLRAGRARPAEDLSRQLLAAVRAWAPTSTPQQDDITCIVIDAR